MRSVNNVDEYWDWSRLDLFSRKRYLEDLLSFGVSMFDQRLKWEALHHLEVIKVILEYQRVYSQCL